MRHGFALAARTFLRRIGLRARHQGMYSDRVIVLDYGVFDRCAIYNCDVVYDGGPVHLNNVRLVGCRWHVTGAAANTVALLKSLNENGARDLIDSTFPPEQSTSDVANGDARS